MAIPLMEEWQTRGESVERIKVAEDGTLAFEGEDVDEQTFLEVLDEAIDAVEASSLPYAVIGGLASAAFGRPRWTHDVDLFVRPGDADHALEALEAAGFATQRTDTFWLFKGLKRGVVVDLIFRCVGEIYFDDEMIERTIIGEFKGRRFRVIAPEDLVRIKAVVHDEKAPRHWYDALGVLARSELDWDYLVRRSRTAARRILSLLLYAESNDIAVPESAIRSLFHMVYSPDHS